MGMSTMHKWKRRKHMEQGPRKRVWENPSTELVLVVEKHAPEQYELNLYKDMNAVRDKQFPVDTGMGGSDVYARVSDAESDAKWWMANEAPVLRLNPSDHVDEFRLDEGHTSGYVVAEGELRNNNFVVYDDGFLGFDWALTDPVLQDTITLLREEGVDVQPFTAYQ